MRVLILGEDNPGGIEGSFARAFAALGADLSFYCMRRAYRSALPGLETRVGRRLLHGLAVRRFNARLVDEVGAERADLVLVLKGPHVMAETVAAIRERTGAPVVNFYPDDPFSRLRSNRLYFGPAVLAAYDVAFTFARHLMPAYRAAGVRDVRYLPFARDPALHAPAPAAGPPEFEAIFVGNLDAERIRWLEPAARPRLAVCGERTVDAVPRRSGLRRAAFLPAAYGADFARLVARGAIALNIMREQNRLSHNMRSFELPACGAFTLTQRTPELEALFVDGLEVACVDSPEELAAAIDYWLARPAERARIAAAGRRRVQEETYEARARTVLDSVGLAPAARRSGVAEQGSRR